MPQSVPIVPGAGPVAGPTGPHSGKYLLCIATPDTQRCPFVTVVRPCEKNGAQLLPLFEGLCPLTFVARPPFPPPFLVLACVCENDAARDSASERKRKAREQKRKRRAVLREEKRQDEERAKKQRLDDAEELKVHFN